MTSRVPLPPPFARAPFAVRTARAAGISRSRLRGADLETPFRGIREVPSAIPDAESADQRERRLLLARCRAFAPRLAPDHFFSRQTAARLWGAPLPDRFDGTQLLHISNPRRAIRSAGVVGHRAIGVTVSRRFGMPVSDAAGTWLSLASELSPPDLVAVGDHLILEPRVLDPRDIRPYVTFDELHDRLAHFSGRGAQAAASALRLMRHGAESRPETLLRLLLGRAGFPEPLLQTEIVDDGGHFLGFADLYYPEFKVIVEYDGDHHRTRVSQYDRDITRIDEFIASGNTVVRVRAARLFRSPSSIAPLVLRAHERQAKVMGLELPLAALRSQLKG